MKYILEINITNFDAVTLGWFLRVLFLVLVCLVILPCVLSLVNRLIVVHRLVF